jgi:saccharopine dehydrogenase-like NADP-dependent oxidoreductase
LDEGVPYMDVADDSDYAQRAKGYGEQARAANIPAITSAGIYPGTSNVMAAHMISIARWGFHSSFFVVSYFSFLGVHVGFAA